MHCYLIQLSGRHYLSPDAADQEMGGAVVPGTWRQEIPLSSMVRASQKNTSEYAKKIRFGLADFSVTKEGELDWHYESAFL